MKKIFAILFVLALGLTLVSCGKEQKELYIISDFAREVMEKELYQNEIFDGFEKKHNVKIKFETTAQAEDTFEKIDLEQKAGKHTVDLVISHFGTMGDYIDPGYVEDVTSLGNSMTDRTFIKTFDENTNKAGKRYFFPINTDVYLTYAKKDAFNSLPEGLTKANVLAGNYTWEEFIAWAEVLGEGSVHIKGLGESMLLYEVGGMALSNGGSFPKINDEGNKKAWLDIIAMKDYITTESLTTNHSGDLMVSDQSEVKLAFELLAPLATAVAQKPAAFEIFPGPKGTSGKAGSIAGGHGIGIVKNAPNRDLAEEFIKWFTAPEQSVAAALGTIPTIEEAANTLGNSAEDQVIKQGLATIANANVEGLQMISDYTSWAEVKGVYDDIFTGIMAGTVTAANLEALLVTQQAALEDLEK